MKRTQPRAMLAEAIAEAIAQFQADLRRVASAVLRDGLANVRAAVATDRAETRPRSARTAARTRNLPTVAPNARTRSTAARRSPKTASAGPAAAPRTRRSRQAPAVTALTRAARAPSPIPHAEPTCTGSAAESMSLPSSLVGVGGAPIEALLPNPPAPSELSAVPTELLAELRAADSTPQEERLTWEERDRRRRDERAQRRQERQERARIRRDEAKIRARSAALSNAPTTPTAVVGAPVPMAATESAAGTDATRATGRRMQRGTVKWFSDSKGYGFVKADDGPDAFVHHSSITGEGFRTLREGQVVSYEEVPSAKGPQAINVVPMSGT